MEEVGPTRRWVKVLLVLLPAWLVVSSAVGLYFLIRGEQDSAAEFPVPRSIEAASLADDLRKLTEVLGERNFRDEVTRGHLRGAERMIEGSLGVQNTGFRVNRAPVDQTDGQQWPLLWVEVRGSQKPGEVVWLLAGYDSASGSAGVDMNATGVAGLLAVAQSLVNEAPPRTLRIGFVPNAYQEGRDPAEVARMVNKTLVEAGGQIVHVVHVFALGRGPDLQFAGPRPQSASAMSSGMMSATLAEPSAGEFATRLRERNLPVVEVTSGRPAASTPRDSPDPQELAVVAAKLRALALAMAAR